MAANQVQEFKPTIIPLRREKGYLYIDPPPTTDIVCTRLIHDAVTDLNAIVSTRLALNTLGTALYKHKTGRERDCFLTALPEGYYMKYHRHKRQYYIWGHPSGHRFEIATIVPHLLWLERCWQEKKIPHKSRENCACILCPSPTLPTNLNAELNNSTVNTFQMMAKVKIITPNPKEFYPKPFTIPLPKYSKPDLSLLTCQHDE